MKTIIRIIVNVILLLFSLTCVYLVAELAVYLLHKEKIALFPRYVTDVTYNDFTIRRNVPNAHYFHKSIDGRWEFNMNSKGFRGNEEVTYEKLEGTLRILLLGDSFTVGYEVQERETYGVTLENYLVSQGIKAEVINTGTSGFSNAEELVFFEQEGVKYTPDIVILGFFQNDYTDNIRTGLYRLDKEGRLETRQKVYTPAIRIRNLLNSSFVWRWLSENSYLHNYLNGLATFYFKRQKANKQKADVIKQIPDAADFDKADLAKDSYEKRLAYQLVRKIYQISKEHEAEFILLDIPQVLIRQKAVGEKLERSFDFEKKSINSVCDYYLDGSKILQPYAAETDLYRPHGHHHWTPEAHRIVGKKLGQVIEDKFI